MNYVTRTEIQRELRAELSTLLNAGDIAASLFARVTHKPLLATTSMLLLLADMLDLVLSGIPCIISVPLLK
jgi:hypothetical protein